MADKKECKICRQMTAEKYKYYNLWKALAIIFMCLTAILSVLYFGSGDVIKHTENNNNQVEIINDGGGNNQNYVTINN